MRTFILILIGTFVFCQSSVATRSSDQGLPVILVKEKNKDVVLEKIFISEGKTEVIDDPSVITLVLPVSVGTSGSLIKPSDRKNKIVIQNENNQLNVKFVSGDGSERGYPPVAPYEELKTFQIRVNITRGDGFKQAYNITNYDIIKKDDAPVLDMFAGMIPLEKDDYSFTIESKVSIVSKSITGSVEFEKVEDWLVAEARLPNGKSGRLIIDTGASGGIVLKKSVLPENTEMSELKAIAYDGENKQEQKGQMQGASGAVEDDNFLGVADLASFEMGDIRLDDVKVSVLREFPEFLNKNDIIGIVGIDILRMADIIRIENIDENKGIINFVNKDNNNPKPMKHNFSITNARDLLFLKGKIQGADVDFLLDTGSRRTLVGKNIVQENDIDYNTLNADVKMAGIDGKGSDAIEAKVSGIDLQDKLFDDITFLISSDLSVTKMMGLEKTGAVLGINFYSKFKTMEIDFINNELRLD